jgi:hypothetical protein
MALDGLMITASHKKAKEDIMDGDVGGEYHLNNSINEEQQQQQEQEHMINSRANHWLFRRRCFQCNKKKVVIGVVIGLSLLIVVASMAKEATYNARFANYEQQCPSEVERWVYYNGAFFKYGLYLQQWPNPDPTMLIFYGGGYSFADHDDLDDDFYANPNNFSNGKGCGGGGWATTYGYADGSSFTLEYSVPQDSQRGGTLSFGGVEYTNLKNNGSVFLFTLDENNERKVTQLSGLDVSSLVIDEETMSIASVTAFCYANQEILDFFDSALANSNNNNG